MRPALCLPGCRGATATVSAESSTYALEQADSALHAAEMTLRQPLAPSTARLELTPEMVASLPQGASYSGRNGRLRASVTRTPSGLLVEAEGDSTGPELTIRTLSAEGSRSSGNAGTTASSESRPQPSGSSGLWSVAVLMLLIILTNRIFNDK